MIYRITGIIRGRKVSRIAFFAVVCKKTFAIQVISLYKNSGQDRKCKKTFANASRFAKFAKLFFGADDYQLITVVLTQEISGQACQQAY